MERASFDRLARRFAGLSGRRPLLAALAAAALASAASPERVLGCAKVGKRCDGSGDCCGSARCRNGKCRCKGARRECGGRCYHLDRDDDHCGGCGIACSAVESCAGGVCIGHGGCPAGADSCGDGGPAGCGNSPNCSCVQSIAGNTLCVDLGTHDGTCGGCASNADCAALGPRFVCTAAVFGGPCCAFGSGNNVCLRLCPSLEAP
jgi:hypothetical protein